MYLLVKAPRAKMVLASFKLSPRDVELLERLVKMGKKHKLAVNKSKLVRYALRQMDAAIPDRTDLERASES